MFIQTEQTPNPATLKFLPGKPVMASGSAELTDPEAARRLSPLAARLFEVDGVTGVYLGADFISVSKAEAQEWHLLKPAVLGAIMEHYLSGEPVAHEGAIQGDQNVARDGEDETVRRIRELIDTRVRPAVAQDGGDIVYRGFKDGTLYLGMQGACAGCPSSMVTLKRGVEGLIKHYVPEVETIEAI
jgi:Fe-S cluster biogenesis protein NfuA